MSDENAPKLRLKPKLAAEAVTTPQPAAAPAPTPAPAPEPEKPAPAPVEEQRSFRLKPKLTAEPAVEAVPAAPAAPAEPLASVANFPAPSSPTPTPDEPAPANLNLPPESTEDVSMQEFAAPSEEPPVIGASDEPVPAPDYVDPDDPSGPVDPESRRALTARPFPPPPANFPAPTVDGVKTVPPWTKSGKPGAAPKKKSPLVLVGGVLTVLIVLGGLFIAYRKFTAPLPEPAPRPRVVAPKKQPDPVPEVAAAHTEAAVTTAQDTAHPAHPTDTAVKPIEEPVATEAEPPPPSPEFKAWVENLKVGGVRAGTQANTRVFIGGVAYAAGETVNSQLGIIFEGYNAETRRLTFVDQHTGAKLDRRN